MTKHILPEAIVSELPFSITKKIDNKEPLTSIEKKEVRSQLNKKVLHPESLCVLVSEFKSLMELYLDVGADIRKESVDYAKNTIDDPELINSLYSIAIDDPVFNIIFSSVFYPDFGDGEISFYHVNCDKGFKRWQISDSSLVGVLKAVSEWVMWNAVHLKNTAKYKIWFGGVLIGQVYGDKIFHPEPIDALRDFAKKFDFKIKEINCQLSISSGLKSGIAKDNANVESWLKRISCWSGDDQIASRIVFPPINKGLWESLIKEELSILHKDVIRYFKKSDPDSKGCTYIVSLSIIEKTVVHPELIDPPTIDSAVFSQLIGRPVGDYSHRVKVSKFSHGFWVGVGRIKRGVSALIKKQKKPSSFE